MVVVGEMQMPVAVECGESLVAGEDLRREHGR